MELSKNPYLRKSLYLLTLVVLIALFTVLYNNQQAQICEQVQVEIDAPTKKQLITVPIVQDKLEEWYDGGLSGVEKRNLALHEIEENLEAIESVKNAEVSFDLRGVLRISIDQRMPIVRILPNAGKSYYLALDGTAIPVAGSDVARVPVATGRLSTTMITKVYTLCTYVYENEFMDALTEQIFVNKTNDLVIVPKIKNQRIIIGEPEQLEEKFQKLQDFYSYGLNHIGWTKYKTINLKYKNQIVCK